MFKKPLEHPSANRTALYYIAVLLCVALCCTVMYCFIEHYQIVLSFQCHFVL